MAELRYTDFAVQSDQVTAVTQANMFRLDVKKCRRNRRIPHALIHFVVIQQSVF
jgi:hypothetical protein